MVPMKSVLVLWALFGSVIGVLDSISEDENLSCPSENTMNGESASVLNIFTNKVIQCFTPKGEFFIKDQLQNANTTEEYGSVIKDYCENTLTYSLCVNNSRNLAKRCLQNETEFNILKIQSNLLHLILEISCAQNGTRLVTILMEENSNSDYREKVSEKCFQDFLIKDQEIDLTGSELSVKQYHKLGKVKECVIGHCRRHEIEFNDVVDILNEVIEKLTCDEADSESEISCKTIIQRNCPKENGENQIGELPTFLENTLDCYFISKDKESLKQLHLSASSVEAFQALSQIICRKAPGVDKCLTDTKILAGHCLLGKNLDMFEGQSYLLDHLFNSFCEDQGIRLSTILAEMRAMVNNTGDINDICKRKASILLTLGHVGGSSYRLTQYRLMKTYTKCVGEFENERNQVLVDTASFFDEIAERMICPDEGGIEVLCKSL